ncbi:DUF6545 domain-containing protein [Microbispora sp. ZYX-F-249]|uniref:DUF6545 domain-containing protein n=1 Tax=Microbispora maris TaxID=3144104 RepID=A0ABV0AIR3_9ACTN
MRQARALHELRPLWKALIGRYPDIALDMDGPLRFRLYRRVLEIRDGMLSLTSVMPAPASEDPREVAAWVTSALRASRPEQGQSVPSGSIPGPDFAGDIERETQWLRQVAAACKQVAKERTVSPAD